MKTYVTSVSFIFLIFFFKTFYASDIIYCGALNSKIIMLHFDDGYVRYHQKGESRNNEWVVSDPLDFTKAVEILNYSIKGTTGFYSNSQNPVKIERKSKGTEFTWLCSNWSQSTGCSNPQADHAKEHWLYLYLQEPLQEGEKYILNTNNIAGNGKEWEFEFNLQENRSEAIHVNLVGYDPRAPKKFGYVYHWAGSAGSIDFSDYSGNNFYLIDTQSKNRVFTGTLNFRKSRNNKETNQSGDTPNQNFLGADVWECNFSEFNIPGEYVLAVEGIGHSFPFKIKNDVYRHAFYTSIRGLYHNRSGIALKEPFTVFTRPAPHNPLTTPGFNGKLQYTTSRFIDWNNLNHSSSDLNAIEDGILGPLNTWGWYQDAGDWDGYITHLKIPAMLMLTWEIAPEKFTDGELNLPEGVNGIPDILDEASWLIRFFYRTRHEIMNQGYGTGGVGSRIAPDWYGHADEGTPSYEDNGKWIISGEDPFTTYFYAGLAGHYKAILNKLGVEDSTDWQKEAEEAYEWALNNTKTNDTNPQKVHGFNIKDFQLYAAVSLYRLTGDPKYADMISENTSSISSTSVLDEDKKWGTYTLVLGDEYEFPDQSVINKLKNAVLATADQKNNSVSQRACRYGGNIWLPMLIGQGTTPRVFEMMMGHYISKEIAPSKTEEYFGNLFTTADYFLGCNPLNMSWVTHVGVRYPERVMHLDSWYNGRDEMAPGITPYGPWRDDNSTGPIGPWSLKWPYKTLYPEGIDNWPGHERWYNNYTTPSNAEFTVHQNTILSAVVYGYLCDEPDGSFQANKHPSVQLTLSNDSILWQNKISLSATAEDPNGANDIAWVEFYNDWHKIGQSKTPPYSVEWKTAKYGETKLWAKVVDKSGYSAKSEEMQITILPEDFKVSIELRDSISGEVISESKVKINGQEQITDEHGLSVFQSVKGRFNLDIDHPDYLTKNKDNIEVYQDTLLTFYLSPYRKNVSIVVHDEYSGVIFNGISVVFNAEEKVTGDDGMVTFEAYTGEYSYSIEKNSFKKDSGILNVVSDTVIHVYLVRIEAEIKFVLSEGSTPLNGANVVLNNDTLTSTSLGIARFKNLPVKLEYIYSISKSGYYDFADTLLLSTDTIININLTRIPTFLRDLKESELKIWPNPVKSIIYFSSNKSLKSVEILSVSGIRVFSQNQMKQTLSFIDMSQLSKGTYVLKFIFTDGSHQVRTVGKY